MVNGHPFFIPLTSFLGAMNGHPFRDAGINLGNVSSALLWLFPFTLGSTASLSPSW